MLVGILGVVLLLNPIYLYPDGGGEVETRTRSRRSTGKPKPYRR